VIKVQVRSNESLEAALRRFKRQCNYSGIFRLVKANAWHEKRSDKRRRERRERLRTIQKATRKNDPNAPRPLLRRRTMRSSGPPRG
jgi:small subunit ribosomal protein S21